MHAYLTPASRDHIQVIWIYGKSGCGKSYYARAYGRHKNQEQVFNKPLNKWWCNYHQQKTVLLDDFAPNQIGLRHLLKWMDCYEVSGEVKSMADVNLTYNTMIVTSNFTPEECFPGEDVSPLKRRIHHYLDMSLHTMFPNQNVMERYPFQQISRYSTIQTFE